MKDEGNIFTLPTSTASQIYDKSCVLAGVEGNFPYISFPGRERDREGESSLERSVMMMGREWSGVEWHVQCAIEFTNLGFICRSLAGPHPVVALHSRQITFPLDESPRNEHNPNYLCHSSAAGRVLVCPLLAVVLLPTVVAITICEATYIPHRLQPIAHPGPVFCYPSYCILHPPYTLGLITFFSYLIFYIFFLSFHG